MGRLSRKTINDSLIPLRQKLARAVRDGVISSNPAANRDRDGQLELPYETPTCRTSTGSRLAHRRLPRATLRLAGSAMRRAAAACGRVRVSPDRPWRDTRRRRGRQSGNPGPNAMARFASPSRKSARRRIRSRTGHGRRRFWPAIGGNLATSTPGALVSSRAPRATHVHARRTSLRRGPSRRDRTARRRRFASVEKEPTAWTASDRQSRR